MYSKIPKTPVVKWGNGRDDLTWVLPALAVHVANKPLYGNSQRVTRRSQMRLAKRIR